MPFRMNDAILVPRQRDQQPLIIALLLILLAVSSGLTACSLLRQQVPTPQPKVMHVTADKIALAMQEDHFYSDYNPYSLIVQGVVTGVRLENKDYILEMATQIDTKVWCDFGSQTPKAKEGDSIEVLTPHANQAQRKPNAVLLVGCSIP
jgi:hypothetical protein